VGKYGALICYEPLVKLRKTATVCYVATNTPLISTRYCGYHHQAASLCEAAELADVLDTLRDLNINPELVTDHTILLDDCGGCDEIDGTRETAVVRVSYTTTAGRRFHEDACPLCLGDIVKFWRVRSTDVRVHLPVPAASFGGAVAA
jgi:hypothetical protein